MLERYEPSGQARTVIGPFTTVTSVGEPELELSVMKRMFTGIAATWGLDNYDPEKESDDYIQAVVIRALCGDFFLGAHEEALKFTFKITNASRGLTHQLVRARFAAWGQEGTRDTNQENFDCLMPETISWVKKLADDYKDIVERMRLFIRAAHSAGIPFQDASYITPKGLLTDIVGHFDYRALRDFCANRLSNTMHWEINRVARQMKMVFIEHYPILGLWLMPRCEVSGICQSKGTLFPPCGKLPLRKDQSPTHAATGQPYAHPIMMNPGAEGAKVAAERLEYESEQDARTRISKWALDVFRSHGNASTQRQLFPGT